MRLFFLLVLLLFSEYPIPNFDFAFMILVTAKAAALSPNPASKDFTRSQALSANIRLINNLPYFSPRYYLDSENMLYRVPYKLNPEDLYLYLPEQVV